MTHIFFTNSDFISADKLKIMTLRPCPACRKPTAWEDNPFKPFCSERCQTRDLGAWSSENYRIAEKPQEEEGEGWSAEGEQH